MTEPSQYFKGRTVQEQMDEVIGYVDVRAAEVATTAIASDVAQVHQDMLDADADASAAAASAAAAAGTLANAVKKTGEASQSIAGDITVGGLLTGTRVTAPTPVFDADAAPKKYVDDADTALKTYVDNQDALKADKTYVNAQDALKINITDINSYAVGLTGNQGPIAGAKTFSEDITIAKGLPLIRTQWNTGTDTDPPEGNRDSGISFRGSDGSEIASLYMRYTPSGTTQLRCKLRNADGSHTTVVIAEGTQ